MIVKLRFLGLQLALNKVIPDNQMNESQLKQNERLLIQAFKSQNQQAYDEALEKLQQAGNSLIQMIQKIEYNSEFYMKHMPLMKQERELINEKDYKEFMTKNQKILCRNFEKNAYLALLMQEMEEKKNKEEKLKWTEKEEQNMRKLIIENAPMKNVYNKFSRRGKHQVDQKYKEIKQALLKKELPSAKISSSDHENDFMHSSD